jgi:uncharacterized membrane protein
VTYGAALFIFAIGAILAFAVEEQPQGIDLQAVGWILMGVAVAGLFISLLLGRYRGPRGPRGPGGPPPPPPRAY